MDCDYRTQFERDYTRIIHSRAFRRLRHKTQVFVDPRNDHICTRLEHSLHVASVARTISKALELNNDLVAAISIGHDLGHAPFGHEGERRLRDLAKAHGITFHHELHSLRVVDRLERMYDKHAGLNLTFAVRDGIACHCGEEFKGQLCPDRDKKPEDLRSVGLGDLPATPEGCVVRLADKVAYLGRDLEDAITVGIISRNEIPKEVQNVLGKHNREIIGALIGGIVSASGPDSVGFSSGTCAAVKQLRDFNDERIYSDQEKVTSRFKQVRDAMAFMFDKFLDMISEAKRSGETFGKYLHDTHAGETEDCLVILAEFLDDDLRTWQKEEPAQLVVDFIAGMTDSFFIRSFKDMFLPHGVV